jgi:hypothetical protein
VQQPFNPYAAASPGMQASGQAVDDIDRIPKAPRMPSPRARQLVVNYGPAGFVLLLVGGIFSFVGVLISIGLCASVPGDLALAVAARTTKGVVTSISTVSNVTVNHVHPQELAFTYRVGGASYRAASSTLSPPASMHQGASVPVEYFGPIPSVARIAGTTRTAGGLLMLFPLLFPIIGFTLLTVAVRGYRRRRRAFVHGTPALGAVVAFGLDASVRINGRNPTKLTWRFTDARGGQYGGSVSTMNRMLLGERGIGAPIVVLYDPSNPNVNTLWVD